MSHHIYKIQKKAIKGASSGSIIGSTLDHHTGILGSIPLKSILHFFFRLFGSPSVFLSKFCRVMK